MKPEEPRHFKVRKGQLTYYLSTHHLAPGPELITQHSDGTILLSQERVSGFLRDLNRLSRNLDQGGSVETLAGGEKVAVEVISHEAYWAAYQQYLAHDREQQQKLDAMRPPSLRANSAKESAPERVLQPEL